MKEYLLSKGSFEVTGKIYVTDPCYSKKEGDTVTLDALPGRWLGQMLKSDKGGWGVRVDELIVRHIDHRHTSRESIDTKMGIAGVDSGQCGFFDLAKYPEGDTGEYGDLDTFYGRACASSDTQDEMLEGVVSSSGFGDGAYECRAKIVDGKVVAARLVFIYDDDLEEEDEEEYEDELE